MSHVPTGRRSRATEVVRGDPRPDRSVGDFAAARVRMRELIELTGGNVADEGVLRAEGDLKAAMASLTGQNRASNLRSGKKMPERSPGARCGGARC